MDTNFNVIGLTRLVIKLESTAQDTNALQLKIHSGWQLTLDDRKVNSLSPCGQDKLYRLCLCLHFTSVCFFLSANKLLMTNDSIQLGHLSCMCIRTTILCTKGEPLVTIGS